MMCVRHVRRVPAMPVFCGCGVFTESVLFPCLNIHQVSFCFGGVCPRGAQRRLLISALKGPECSELSVFFIQLRPLAKRCPGKRTPPPPLSLTPLQTLTDFLCSAFILAGPACPRAASFGCCSELSAVPERRAEEGGCAGVTMSSQDNRSTQPPLFMCVAKETHEVVNDRMKPLNLIIMF